MLRGREKEKELHVDRIVSWFPLKQGKRSNLNKGNELNDFGANW